MVEKMQKTVGSHQIQENKKFFLVSREWRVSLAHNEAQAAVEWKGQGHQGLVGKEADSN